VAKGGAVFSLVALVAFSASVLMMASWVSIYASLCQLVVVLPGMGAILRDRGDMRN